MIEIGNQQQHFLFDRRLKPAATIRPGDAVTFVTQDACLGEVRSVEQFLQRRATDRPSNPMTGPVFVAGAKPGHTLVVEIQRIELDPDGFQLIGPNRALVRDEIPEWTCYAFRVEGERVIFPNGLEVPAAPVIGQFGNAPAGEPTNLPNPLGGNVDCPHVRVGAKLHIPIEVDGALFSLGDVHACQGDGEVVGAPEIGARVTVGFDLVPHRHADWFMIEDATHWRTCCAADTEEEASRLALWQNAHFVARTQRVALKDALVLLTLLGELSIARRGKWGAHNPVVCASFSKQRLTEAVRRYRPA
ncbi:MAG: acetamidase/formamidase family protein [Verrucomicrobiae bacterium]|nr:acetamidase/formamidase family protein [Verrucomicrobiae bacterium]